MYSDAAVAALGIISIRQYRDIDR